MHPLVSVMMPCYNGCVRYPGARASLVAQTHADWECVLVDDGSTDGSLDVVDRLGDPRVKVIRLERNMGRGVARQVALDNARGDLLCMLDADDWIFPTKLERQADALASETGLSLVSTGFAIVDTRNELVGIRARGPDGPLRARGPVRRVAAPWLPFAASMMRTGLASQVRFDAQLTASEDLDFLIIFLLNQHYAILPEASYVYTEHASTTLGKMVLSLRLARKVFLKHRHRFPIGSRLNAARTIVKEYVYRAGFALGQGDRLIRRRSSPPTASDLHQFEVARRQVGEHVARLFPGHESPCGDVPSGSRAAGIGCGKESR